MAAVAQPALTAQTKSVVDLFPIGFGAGKMSGNQPKNDEQQKHFNKDNHLAYTECLQPLARQKPGLLNAGPWPQEGKETGSRS